MIDFNKMIDRYLFREQKPKTHGRYYPSEIGMCLRKIWYSYKFPQQTEPQLLRVFELGNILHDFVVKVMQSDKNPDVDLLEFEVPIKLEVEDFLISGRVDDLILLKSDGKHVLVEVKSCKTISFINEPQHHHTMQLQFYMHATGVHNGVLLYVDKSTLESRVFTLPYNPVTAASIILRFKNLHTALTQNVLPHAEAKNDMHYSWMCRFCEYRAMCDRNATEQNVKQAEIRLCDDAKKIEELTKKLSIKESLRGVYTIDGDFIIHTELRIIRCSGDGAVKWKSEFHYDVILEIDILMDKIKVKEMKGTEYSLDINTGKTVG